MDRAEAIKTLIALAVCSVDGLLCREDCPVKDKCWNEKGGDAWTEDGVREAVHFLREQEQSNKPLTLEELRKMYGEPVWVKVIDHNCLKDVADDFDGWALVRTSWVRLWDAKRADLICVDWHFEEYGKTWLAYRKPPKEGADHV